MSTQATTRPPANQQRPRNTQLRSAREARGLTRSELSEAAAAWIYTEYGRIVALDAHYIAKLERGVVRRPGDLYRLALRTVLRVDSDSELGMPYRDPVPDPLR